MDNHNQPQKYIEHGIKIVYDNGHTKYLNYETQNEAQSAQHDWAAEIPTAKVTLTHRTVHKTQWENTI